MTLQLSSRPRVELSHVYNSQTSFPEENALFCDGCATIIDKNEPFQTIHEFEFAYCSICKNGMTAQEAKQTYGRCQSCFECPQCDFLLQATAQSIPQHSNSYTASNNICTLVSTNTSESDVQSNAHNEDDLDSTSGIDTSGQSETCEDDTMFVWFCPICQYTSKPVGLCAPTKQELQVITQQAIEHVHKDAENTLRTITELVDARYTSQRKTMFQRYTKDVSLRSTMAVDGFQTYTENAPKFHAAIDQLETKISERQRSSMEGSKYIFESHSIPSANLKNERNHDTHCINVDNSSVHTSSAEETQEQSNLGCTDIDNSSVHASSTEETHKQNNVDVSDDILQQILQLEGSGASTTDETSQSQFQTQSNKSGIMETSNYNTNVSSPIVVSSNGQSSSYQTRIPHGKTLHTCSLIRCAICKSVSEPGILQRMEHVLVPTSPTESAIRSRKNQSVKQFLPSICIPAVASPDMSRNDAVQAGMNRTTKLSSSFMIPNSLFSESEKNRQTDTNVKCTTSLSGQDDPQERFQQYRDVKFHKHNQVSISKDDSLLLLSHSNVPILLALRNPTDQPIQVQIGDQTFPDIRQTATNNIRQPTANNKINISDDNRQTATNNEINISGDSRQTTPDKATNISDDSRQMKTNKEINFSDVPMCQCIQSISEWFTIGNRNDYMDQSESSEGFDIQTWRHEEKHTENEPKIVHTVDDLVLIQCIVSPANCMVHSKQTSLCIPLKVRFDAKSNVASLHKSQIYRLARDIYQNTDISETSEDGTVQINYTANVLL